VVGKKFKHLIERKFDMGRLDLGAATHFVVDYRSAPLGVGSIICSDGRVVLVTEEDCGPKSLREARGVIKAEYMPEEVEHIPLSMGERWEEGNQMLGDILERRDVKYVVDTELAYEFEDLTEDINQCVFAFRSWCKIRGIKV
jgi:hypothetical protein